MPRPQIQLHADRGQGVGREEGGQRERWDAGLVPGWGGVGNLGFCCSVPGQGTQ